MNVDEQIEVLNLVSINDATKPVLMRVVKWHGVPLK